MPFLLAEILNFQGSTHHIGVGSFSNLPKGCTLASRCMEAEKICFERNPDMVETEPGHFVKCHKAIPCVGCSACVGKEKL